MRRDLRNKETIDALLDIMVGEGLITEKEKDELVKAKECNECRELGKGLRKRRENK